MLYMSSVPTSTYLDIYHPAPLLQLLEFLTVCTVRYGNANLAVLSSIDDCHQRRMATQAFCHVQNYTRIQGESPFLDYTCHL